MDANDLYDGPLVILTSRLTASAAEIVAQSLQDYGVALIVGDDHTYGKGTIQSQTVTDGKDVASYFKVTVGKYYTVSGKTPQLKGVQADIVVPGLLSAQEIGEEYLERSSTLPSDTIASVYNDSLKDIEPSLKSWYMKYYIPNIQRRELEWRSLLPELKKNSASRIFHNHDYQFFLKSLSENPDEPDDSADYQLDEAVNIVKDMIYLQSKIVQRKRAGVPIK
jgi:carboxyl-terminal processing protease